MCRYTAMHHVESFFVGLRALEQADYHGSLHEAGGTCDCQKQRGAREWRSNLLVDGLSTREFRMLKTERAPLVHRDSLMLALPFLDAFQNVLRCYFAVISLEYASNIAY